MSENQEPELLKLAEDKFGNLKPSECELFRRVAKSEPADYRTNPQKDDDPQNGSNWGENRTLRSDLIRWLCIECEGGKLCLPQGVKIFGAKIEGSLDLSFTKVNIPLSFIQCYFVQPLLLQQAKLRNLDLSGTHIAASDIDIFPSEPCTATSINAREISVRGSVYLNKGFQASGTVILYSATIGGSLFCTKGRFSSNQGKYALFAQSIKVGDSVYLNEHFEASGKVNLYGATIGRDLICSKGSFTNKDGEALLANSINVTGSVLLNDGFKASGIVSLYGATIGGELDCTNGTFENEKKDALIAKFVNVTGSVFLKEGFKASGIVSLYGATIKGDLECCKGTFTNINQDALMAQSVNVTGSVFLHDDFKAFGIVNLYGAHIGKNLDCTNGTFINKNKDESRNDALFAENINVKGSVLLKDFEASGNVSLFNATIDKSLRIKLKTQSNKMVLNLQSAKVQTLEHLEEKDINNILPSQGNLRLNGFVYEALGTESLKKSFEQHLNWLRLQPKCSFSSQPYEQLAKVLVANGDANKAMDVLIGKEDDKLLYRNLNQVSKFWKQVLRFTICYGYRPEWIFFFVVPVVILGTFIFQYGYKEKVITPTDKLCKPYTSQQEKKDCSLYPYYPTFDPFIYSLDSFLPIIDLGLKNYWLPNENEGKLILNRKTGVWQRYYLVFHIISGWVLTTLLVAGFSGIVRSNNKR